MVKLETEPLILRQWKASDFGWIADYFADEESAQYVGGKKTREEAWRLMASYIGHWQLRGFGYMAVEEKVSGEFAGSVGLWKSEPWPELELGYWFLKKMRGKGYATEGAGRLKRFAFETLKIKTLVSYIHPANTFSIKLAERLGGILEGMTELLDYGKHCVYRYGP